MSQISCIVRVSLEVTVGIDISSNHLRGGGHWALDGVIISPGMSWLFVIDWYPVPHGLLLTRHWLLYCLECTGSCVKYKATSIGCRKVTQI